MRPQSAASRITCKFSWGVSAVISQPPERMNRFPRSDSTSAREASYTSSAGRSRMTATGAHGLGWADGAPVVQYDTRKVLAFMFLYYHETYGYTPSGTFSIKLDDRGEKLFVCWNGAFVEHREGVKPEDTFGQCPIMVITIPESERKE